MSQVRLNGKCTCGQLHTRLAEGTEKPGVATYYHVDGKQVGSTLGGVAHCKLTITCPCGAKVVLKDVRGKMTKHKCDDKCQYAESELHTCRCSCGGLNHGRMGMGANEVIKLCS